MELKFDRNLSVLRRIGGSNRTFMELKYLAYMLYYIVKAVLIAPLWN